MPKPTRGTKLTLKACERRLRDPDEAQQGLRYVKGYRRTPEQVRAGEFVQVQTPGRRDGALGR